MTIALESLTPTQLAAIYNHHSDIPVKKFENRQKGARRLAALLAKIEVDPADAIAAVIPSATADAAARHAALDAAYNAGYAAGHADATKTAPKPAKAREPRAIATTRGMPTMTAGRNARDLIIAACRRPEGATSAELFETTGWKYASWSHQLKLITKKTGSPHEISRVDGTTRYFLTGRV
jgi:hypothetical protein